MADIIKFYDTNAILRLQEKIFNQFFYISSVTLEELENIKTSANKTEDLRYAARKVAHLLDEHIGEYGVVFCGELERKILATRNLDPTPDALICASAYEIYLSPETNHDNELVFVTDDICCRLIAHNIFELNVSSADEGLSSNYEGIVTAIVTEEELAEFYNNPTVNHFHLLTNQYIFLYLEGKSTVAGEVDILRWTGERYVQVSKKSYKSNSFGAVRAYNNDPYQICALDSFENNKLTMVYGAAGTGKSYLALGYLLSQLEKHKIDKIVIFTNPTPTAYAAKLGFYPGTRHEKMMESNIGNMLASKFGDIVAVEQLIEANKLVILPMCDIRGYDTTNMNAGVYITEAQNMDISLMKLALQRIGEDCSCIIEGDFTAQVDLPQYNGDKNGMRRLSETFRGQDFYGEIELKNIYRSKIAAIADQM